ncbi:hypothetical protein WJT86_04065 [Microvirga sp. W0021]|uniref:Uncharacterized protein n=1 Tax=Hohaiivirga grylli TaxID=3133970 RepID=A0ABV0BIZ5_9HYPH
MRSSLFVVPMVAFSVFAGSSLAKAESGPWYNGFQIQACEKHPEQAGCFNYPRNKDDTVKTQEDVKKSPRKHKR